MTTLTPTASSVTTTIGPAPAPTRPPARTPDRTPARAPVHPAGDPAGPARHRPISVSTALRIAMPSLFALRSRAALARRPRATTVLAAIALGAVVLAAAWPTLFTAVDPLSTDPVALNREPSAEHPLGTDYLGRDLYSRIIHGARAFLQRRHTNGHQ